MSNHKGLCIYAALLGSAVMVKGMGLRVFGRALSFLAALGHLVDGGLSRGKAAGTEVSYSGNGSGHRGGTDGHQQDF